MTGIELIIILFGTIGLLPAVVVDDPCWRRSCCHPGGCGPCKKKEEYVPKMKVVR